MEADCGFFEDSSFAMLALLGCVVVYFVEDVVQPVSELCE